MTTAEHTTQTAESNRDLFLHQLNELDEALTRNDINYRVIGSVAFTAIANEAGYDAELDFNRSGAVTPDQAVPDIDLIVPRAHTGRAKELRDRFKKDSRLPLKLGLAAGVQTFDFLPDSDTSYLTHKDISVPFDTYLLAGNRVSLGDQAEFTALSPQALAHTYGTIGGVKRTKDTENIATLFRIHEEGGYVDHDFNPFDQFYAQRADQYPLYVAANRSYQYMSGRLHPLLSNSLEAAMLPVADALKLR